MEWRRMRTVGAGTRRATRRTMLLIACCVSGIASGQSKGEIPKGMTTDIPGAQQGIHLISPVPNGQWILPAGDYANTRYTPLSQINTTNVQNLHVVATYSTGIPHGHEGQPLVV